MTRTLLLSLLCLGLAACSADRANIVLILVDDMGYADLGVQGGPGVLTPRIDHLAAQGVRCTAAYVSTPSCSPCRAGLMTGRYSQRFGYEFNPIRPVSGGVNQGLPLEEKTLADRLKPAGYATGAFGKWHLGEEPQFHPLKRGFDEFYGFLWGGHDYFIGDDPEKGPILLGTQRVELRSYLTDAIADHAADFIRRHRGRPFFAYVAFNAPHAPMQAPAQDIARFASELDERRRIYLAMMRRLDAAVGRLLDTLKDTGLERDTLVVFLSDNGGATTKFSPNGALNTPLRGSKGDTWEGGIRVPMILRWPAALPAGRIYDHPVSALDLAPTALAAAGVARRDAWKLDGVDLTPHLAGRIGAPPHASLFWRYGKQMAVRRGEWKLVRPSRGAREFEDVAVEPMLFNLAQDIGEQRDLTAEHPRIVRELQSEWDQWNMLNAPPRWAETINGKPVQAK